MSNKIYFMGILTALVILLRIAVEFLPAPFSQALTAFVLGSLNFYLVTFGAFFLWIGSQYLTGKIKWLVCLGDSRIDPANRLSMNQHAAIAVILALVMGFVWIVLPDYLVIPGGWYHTVVVSFTEEHFAYHTAHILSGVYGAIASAAWYAVSDDTGDWE